MVARRQGMLLFSVDRGLGSADIVDHVPLHHVMGLRQPLGHLF